MNHATIYHTCEDCTITLQNPTPEILDEFLKAHHGHKITTTSEYQLYDLGYNDLKTAAELAQIAQALNAIIADIRFMPHTRNPEFSQKHLQEILGDKYTHIRALGNQNYRGEGEIQLVNVDAGMAELHRLLEHSHVIIMCACWKRSECHRVHVGDEYLHRFSITAVPITKAAARQLLESAQEKQNPQMPLFS